MTPRPDVAIVGGGLAGSIAAIHLARSGARVLLVERESGPKTKVCGEFLSAVALGELARAGVPAESLGAVPLSRARVSARRRTAGVGLPFRAASLTRDRLDEALLAAAVGAGVDVRRGLRVRALERSGRAWRMLTGETALTADSAMIACGKADLPGRRRGGGVHGSLVGLKRRAFLSSAAMAALGDASELALFAGGYCGIQPVEDGSANVCLVIEAAALKGGGPAAAFEAVRNGSTRAAELLDDAEWLGARPASVGFLPYGYVRRRTDGPYHLGDQAAVIPSFCGEGMAIALVSGRLAAEAVIAGRDAAAFQRRFASLVAPRVRGAALLSRALCEASVQSLAVALAPTTPPLIRRIAAATRTPLAEAPLPLGR